MQRRDDLMHALSKAQTRYALHNLPSDRDEVVRLQDALNRLDDEGNNFFDAAARNGWCLNLQAKA